MTNNFDLKKYLIENKATTNARLITENEEKLQRGVADLYAYAGIQDNYNDDLIQSYGQDVVDLAIQMAPKVQEFKLSLQKMVDELKTKPEAKLLMNVIKSKNEYAGRHTFHEITIDDVISAYTK